MSNVGRSAAHAAVTEHNMMVADLEEAQAAIQRVWDVTAPVPGDVYDLDSYTRCAADALALTNKALDGDSDE